MQPLTVVSRLPGVLVLAIAGVGLIATGCGGSDSPEVAPAPSAVVPAPTEMVPEPSEVDPAPIEVVPGSSLAAPTTSDVIPTGFERATFTHTPPSRPGSTVGGTGCELCVWTASTTDQRRRGLMEVTALGDPVGMAFLYDVPRTSSFTMRNTLIPLSIAFFDTSGTYIDSFDMEPCTDEPCESYPTPADFSLALEVPSGDLQRLGIGPGSTLVATAEGCPPTSE